jgi:hypothetical protein
MLGEYDNFIKDDFPDATEDQVVRLSQHMERFRINDANRFTLTLDKDKINVLNVSTGLLPRTKAEEFLRNVADIINKSTDGTGLECLILGHSTHQTPASVTCIEKDKAYVVEIDTGLMPPDKAESYMNVYRVYEERLNDVGYKVTFIRNRASQTSIIHQ